MITISVYGNFYDNEDIYFVCIENGSGDCIDYEDFGYEFDAVEEAKKQFEHYKENNQAVAIEWLNVEEPDNFPSSVFIPPENPLLPMTDAQQFCANSVITLFGGRIENGCEMGEALKLALEEMQQLAKGEWPSDLEEAYVEYKKFNTKGE